MQSVRAEGLALLPVTEAEVLAGRGVEGVVQGQRLVLGSGRLMSELGCPAANRPSCKPSAQPARWWPLWVTA
jgi:cation transport ATPase